MKTSSIGLDFNMSLFDVFLTEDFFIHDVERHFEHLTPRVLLESFFGVEVLLLDKKERCRSKRDGNDACRWRLSERRNVDNRVDHVSPVELNRDTSLFNSRRWICRHTSERISALK